MFIVFEGIDGAGKSSQIERLMTRLKQRNQNIITVSDPHSTELGKRVGKLVQDSNLQISPLSEMFLFQATHAELVVQLIQPALAEGKIVIADRFIASTTAYQGAGHGIETAIIERCNKVASNGLVPTVQILLDVDLEISRERIKQNAVSRIESLPRDFQKRVIMSYREQAQTNPNRWIVVDAAQDDNAVEAQIWAKLGRYFDDDAPSSGV